MKLSHIPSSQSNLIIDLHNNEWLEKQRVSGKVVSGCLKMLSDEVKSGTQKTMLELDTLAGNYIRDHQCTPTFHLYHGFPGQICISLNQTLVHGVPGEERLQDGDLITFDLGATFEGVISDAARTVIFGTPKSKDHELLIQTTQECLQKAIDEVQIGKKLGVIGNVIFKYARGKGFSVVDSYGGHGISRDRVDPSKGIPHASPFVSNKAEINEGPTIQAGMSLAIEPLLVIGKSNRTKTLNDGWTVVSDDICAHCEDTIFVKDDGSVEVLTR